MRDLATISKCHSNKCIARAPEYFGLYPLELLRSSTVPLAKSAGLITGWFLSLGLLTDMNSTCIAMVLRLIFG